MSTARSAFGGPLDLKLIEFVKENPLLYNPSHQNYSEAETREATWQKIGDILHRPAAEFAGIQCHIQFGDYHEEKHKPGFIENPHEYLPEQYCSVRGIDKKILKEYSSHVGLTELEAKHLYTKTARELPTYGVTFFLVKEKQKGKKKLVPRLLGINSEAILRLDECTKEILQQWPLTHVKTYHAGKGETFTLNFGDYVDKEYSVKTRDAFRIQDILEGYIDLIRKQMLANYNQTQTEVCYIGQDTVSCGQASMMQHISNSPMKIIEQAFVGPSTIVEYEPGQKACHGTQMITVQQMVTSELINKQGQGVKGEVPLRKDMGIPFARRLNRLNSNSVKIVTLLTEPSQGNLEDAKEIVDAMSAEMPAVKAGVKETMANQTDEEEQRKLQEQLHQLDELMKLLSDTTRPGTENPIEAEDAAKQVADLTTAMYFAIDPKTRRRSRILSRTRESFIADDRMEKNLRRASFIAATATANHAIDNAQEFVTVDYLGPPLDASQVEQLERSAVDKLGKLNAAIAHYLLAHSDPQNIDYGAAVNSLNAIHKLMPELAKDAQALASAKDGKDRKELLADIKDLCAAAKHVCSLSGVEDAEKLQDASAKYIEVSGKLIFTFGKGMKARAEKENEVIGLAKEAGVKASELLISAQGLTETAASEPGAVLLDEAGVKTATAAKDLISQAEINAPTIHEPHCQSALTAAAEGLSSSAQHLAATWKPLVEDPARHEIGEKLHNRTMDLAKALDRLKESYSNLGDVADTSGGKPDGEAQRLKFINSLNRVKGGMQTAEDDLNKPVAGQVSEVDAREAQRRLAERLARLNAAIAGLLAATGDRENPDYATAEQAVATINELMPELVKDSKTAAANQDEASRAALLDEIRALCAGSKDICACAYGAQPEDLSAAVGKFTDATGKLTYVVNKRANPNKEAEIIEQSKAAYSQAGVLVCGVQQLAGAAGGAGGAELGARGAELAHTARALLTAAQVTAPSMSDPRCQSALLDSADRVTASGRRLEKAWELLEKDPRHEDQLRALKKALNQLDNQLDNLRATCQEPDLETQNVQESQLGEPLSMQGSAPQEQQKLQFIKSMNGAKGKLENARKELNKPAMPAKGADTVAVEARLAQHLGQLNAAIAALLAATADRQKPDYAAAEQAANTISDLMPRVVQDTKTVSVGKDEPTRAAMLAQIKELCDASEGICVGAGGSSTQGLNDAVAKFSDASGKLVYVVSPRANAQKEDEIVSLSGGACQQTSALLAGVQRLAEAVGGAQGQDLDAQGGRVADAAQGLLQAAQITAPSMSSPQCQAALLSSVDNLSSAGHQLAASLAPLHNDPKHNQQVHKLNQALQQLEAQLETLRKACKAPEGDLQDPIQKQQKLQFTRTMQGAKERLGDAQKELKKPAAPAKGADMDAVQTRLSHDLEKLNAAIAALLAATADREKPNYAAAEKAASTIADLMPHIVKDTKTVSVGKDEPTRAAMLAQIKELCDASEGICVGAGGSSTQGLNDAVAKFSDASGKLVYVVSPRANAQKEDEIVSLSGGACQQTSALLAGVQRLAEAVGGAQGQDLDAQGGRVADAAQGLLQAAQITAPSMSSPQCQAALLSSVDNLSSAGHQLAASLAPLHNDPKHNQQVHKLNQALQQLEAQLETLRKACKAPEGDLQDPIQKQQKLQFTRTMQGAKERLGDAQKELKKPAAPAKGADMDAVQTRLSHDLEKLNAAIAALLAATADREKPNYAAAEKAASTIADLMPHIVKDTKTVSVGKDEPTRAAMLAQIKELCDASEGICVGAGGSSTQGLNDAVAKFSDASGKLVYVVSPRVNAQKEVEIVSLSGGACQQTSALLAGVQRLAEAVGGAQGQDLDAQGGRVADAAQGLLQAAQITAPSMSSPQCQAALLSSVDNLSSAGHQLAASLAPLHNDPKHNQQVHKLNQALQQLEAQLETLRKACKAPEGDLQDPIQKQQKLQFTRTMQGAKERLGDAQKELKKPAAPAKGADMDAVQTRLSHDLEKLNAAIAALLAATADREKPNYAAAEKAASTIADLMPHIVKDTKTVSVGKDEPTRAAMLAQIKELCDASEGICVGAGGSSTQGLNDAVAKFSDASGKLVYVVSPRVNAQKEVEIVSLSGGACQQTSALLAGVQRLAEAVGGAQGQDLDAQGGRVADAAQGLLQAAQITAPSMSSPQCQAALLSSVDNLSSAGHQLAASLAPLHNDPKHNQQVHKLNQALQQLEAQLETLRKACKAPEGDLQDPVQKQQKLQFTTTMQGAKERLGDAQKELKKPAAPAKGADMDAVQTRLSHDLEKLNAAIAALLAATADREKPNYAAAEKAASTIADLMPHIVKDTKTVSVGKDEPTRAAMLAQIKELCDASEGICVGAGGSSTQGLNDAVAKFSDASGKLVYVVSPRVNAQKEVEIVSLSGGACQQTSALLAGVQRLAEAVGGAQGQDLDAQGGRVADAAQGLLQAAQITAPSMSSPQCQAALLSSVDNLSSAGHQLAASLAPLHNDPKHNQQVHKLNQALQQLEAQLETLRKACKAPEGDLQDPVQKQQKLQFTTTMQGAKERLGDAQKELKKPAAPAKGADMDAVQTRLSHDLEKLNAAIAALLAATADREKPNYAAAEKAASTIADLMPHIVKDTKTVSVGKDEPTRAAMLAQIKELCDASEGICVGAGGSSTQGLNDAVAKFSDASGKLVYVVSPRVNAQKEVEIVSLSGGACQQTSALLAGVQRLAEAVGGAQGQDLDAQGGRVADAAQGLLQAAQITAPSMSSPQCQAALLSSVDNLSSAGHQLAASLAPLHNDPKHNQQVHKLNQALQQLEAQLETLRKACKAPEGDLQDPVQKQQKLQFTRTMQGAKERLGDAQKELKKPAAPAKGADMDAVQTRLSHDLEKLNAAIAALLAATADREKPNYAAAEKAASTIADLMPHIVKDTKTVSVGKDEPTRAAMLAQIKELCDASEGICVGAGGSSTQGLNDAVAKFSDASGKLVYVVSPRANAQKEDEIVSLSGGACQQTSALLAGVQRLAEAVGGAQGQDLDAQGGRVADAAQGLLQAAQITAPSMSSPQCQAALLSSVDNLSSAGHQLAASLAPLHNDPKHNQQVHKLNQALQQLEAQLETLRKACKAPGYPSEPKSPPLPASKPPTTRAPSVIAHAVPHVRRSTDFTQDFLNTLRCEESMAHSHQPSPSPKVTSPSVVGKGTKVKPPPPPRDTEEDKRQQQQFEKIVDEATMSIKQKEANLMKLCKQDTSTGPALSQSEMVKKQLRLQQDLAMADVEVARLVAANYADKIDYAEASKSTKSLDNWMTSIVEGGKQLSDNVNDMARKAFLYDMLQLCEANRKICDAVKSDRQKLNDAAVHFGDTSAKLLYVVSSDVDPALEKEIISRAIAIGDSASHLALDAAGIATAPPGNASGSVQDICDAGTACVDAASKVVYTAKLTAPSIQESPCQEALVHSTETLSKKLKTFTDSWKPLASDPQQASTIKHLTKEADNLERILEGLRSDVRGGSLRKRREVEQLVVEDTPLRQLTVQVLDGAKVYAECTDLPATQKIEYASYADKLQNALRAVDLANARCKKTPHDTNKRRELENAIQNLQVILLQSRPTRGDKGKSNIVDLRDFIDEVSSEAKKMSAASDVRVPSAQDKRTLEEINEKCKTIEAKANKLMNVDSRTDLESTFDDILEVDQFGLDCDSLIKEINADLKGMEDAKAKRLLLSRMLPLSESCNLLRFATKSGISTEAGAGLDSSLDDLDRIEAEVIHSIVTDADKDPDKVVVRSKQPSITGHSPATINLCREVADSSSGVDCATVTAYIADAASKTDTTNPEEKNKLLKHLYKLVHLVKTLTITTSMRSATWRPLAGPDVATVTEQILQEIYNPESKFGVKPGAETNKIIEESELAKLLIPPAPLILNEPKLQEHKLSELAGQVVSTCGALRGGPGAPVAARAALAAVQASTELNAVARGTATHDAIKYKLVDKAAKEMSFATYNVIKTAESANLEPNNQNLRRRLIDACESLNRAVNKLVSVSSSSPPLSQRCGALSRDVALQLCNMQPRPVGAAPFQDTCDQLQQQKDNIYKLKNERPMPRVEFMRDLDDIGAALRRSTECATQCAYYIAISDLNKDMAKTGLIDVPHIQKSIENIQDSCMAIIGCSSIQQAKEEREDLHKRVLDLSGALDKAQVMVADGDVKRTLASARSCISEAAGHLDQCLNNDGDMVRVTPRAVSLLEAVNRAHSMVERCPLVPTVGDMAADTKAKCEEVMGHSKNLLTNTLELLKDVNSSSEEPETLTWATYNTSRRKLLDAYDALLTSVKRNGHRAGILEKAPEEDNKKVVKKSYIEIQVDLANKWLKSPACKPEAKSLGQQAVRNVVDVARQMSEDLKGTEREEIRNTITDTEELLSECSKKYDHEKNCTLSDRLKELKKAIQRGVVTRVVEDFIEAEAPLADLDVLADSEKDELKRKFILERKIASLLAQLGRVTRTARFVAGASQHLGVELTQCSEQAELLAPMLVQAAQQRIDRPDDTAIVEKYKSLLAQYAESVSKVRDLCDRAVDPMEFVQAAGDTMQRMREDMTLHNNDPHKCAYSSYAISRLANRVIHVSMSSPAVQEDPEMQKALRAAEKRLKAAAPPVAARASRLPDWRESTAEILRTTGDVESALGGENIFKKQPTTANQPIYSVAQALHESVREWSSRDNEIVAVARRMAVLMARLSEYMETDKKQALITTSKSIVVESQEVAELAKKLAHECSDVRIKRNLLQTCERIPTISGQLKMLTTVKGSSLGHQGSQEDKEAMDMLVVNAQSLMMSIQEVVKAAAGASVKIMSQRGPRLRWVRKNYY